MSENEVRRKAWQIVEDLRRCAKEVEAPADIAALMAEAADEIDSAKRQSDFIYNLMVRLSELTDRKLVFTSPKRKS